MQSDAIALIGNLNKIPALKTLKGNVDLSNPHIWGSKTVCVCVKTEVRGVTAANKLELLNLIRMTLIMRFS